MKTKLFTPENITELKENEVFVFGSNLNGNHAGGAAKLALEKFEAIQGQAEGIQGQSYAIPTLDENYQKISIDIILADVSRFIEFTKSHPENTFFLTKIGCGIAGYNEIDFSNYMLSLNFPKNVILPRLFTDGDFRNFIIKLNNNYGVDYILNSNSVIIVGGYVDLRSLTSLPEGVQFNNGGYVYLSSLTSLPEGVQFNNGGNVDLSSLTSLPEGVQFNNGGNVDLSSLTSLPEGVQFNNGGYVDLRSLTSLPEGVQFNNGGYVYLSSLTSLPEGVQFNNGGYVDLSSLTSLPEGVQFNNGGNVDLRSQNINININKSYIQRFNIKVCRNSIILYKRVSIDFKTQEKQPWETEWKIGTTLNHPSWNPSNEECGSGKYHACAKPSWCDAFRSNSGDKYIAISIKTKDLYEWRRNPSYPSKIAFKKCKVLFECDRNGNKINQK